MAKTLQLYKNLYKNINRLPLDVTTLELAKSKARNAFRYGRPASSYSVPDRKRYDLVMKTVKEILHSQDFKYFPQLLDLIYKDPKHNPEWTCRFLDTRYSLLKNVWPQVHLLHEFGPSKSVQVYDNELSKAAPQTNDFLLMQWMEIPDNVEVSLTPLPRQASNDNDLKQIVTKAEHFHKFLLANGPRVTGTKVKPFDVYYEPNRFGLPASVPKREHNFRTKITYMKHLVLTFRPLDHKVCLHLKDVASGRNIRPETVLNPNFARFMSRQKRRSVQAPSPFEQKYLRQKLLIANDRNIRYLYKDYAFKQFYVDEKGEYHMIPMHFYD